MRFRYGNLPITLHDTVRPLAGYAATSEAGRDRTAWHSGIVASETKESLYDLLLTVWSQRLVCSTRRWRQSSCWSILDRVNYHSMRDICIGSRVKWITVDYQSASASWRLSSSGGRFRCKNIGFLIPGLTVSSSSNRWFHRTGISNGSIYVAI